MSLNYEKLKQKPHQGDSFWTSYADLATVLMVIFLAMYAVATLRTTTVSISEQNQVRIARQQVEEMREQIKAFDVLKEDYLDSGASKGEQKMYKELLDQMKLLEQQAQSDQEDLQRQAKESEVKAEGLNKYQASIKNIIIANMLAQQKLKGRDTIIAQKSKNITELRSEVKGREQQIKKNNQEIEAIQSQLQKSISDLKYAAKSKARSRKKMEEQVAFLKAESQKKIVALKSQNQQVAGELENAKQEIGEQSKELEEKDTVLEQRQEQVARLKKEKNQVVAQLGVEQQRYQQAISDLKKQHDIRLEQERKSYQDSLLREQLSAKQKIEREQAYRTKVEAEKNAYNFKLEQLNGELEGTQKQISQKEQELEGARKAMGKMASTNQGLERELADVRAAQDELKKQHELRLEQERKAYQDSLLKEKLSAQQKVEREEAYRAKVEAEKNAYNAKVEKLNGELKGMASTNRGLERELASVRAAAEAKHRLASKIKANFKKAGIDAHIDGKTGEVTLNFGEEYFDYGSPKLKGGMQKILERAIPLYAQSILEDPSIAQKISSVEITGFASPTYKGKYVNPKDVNPKMRKAVNYNLDLSYKRAKSIFEYVFDQRRMNYKHQQELLSLTKVTGLGYLRAQGAEGANLSDEEYCDKYDCTKSQKVLIKFNFADK